MVRACGSYPQCPGFNSLRRHLRFMRGIKAFQRKLEQTLKNIPPLKPGQSVLVGVSGGADSCALLFSLFDSQYKFKISVAHFDHQLRPTSGEDLEFVSRLSSSLNLPFYQGRGEVIARKEREGLSLEEAARLERMDFLLRLKNELSCDWVALGHTADDQVETVLLRLLAGSGLEGLKGIPLYDEKRGLMHPLLFHWHGETVSYCKEEGVEFREDPTNYMLNTPRNVIRNRLLPEILNFFPQAKDGVFRSGLILKEENLFLEEQARVIFPEMVEERKGSFLISLKLQDYPLALQRRVIQMVLHEALNEASFYEIESVRALLSKQVGKRAELGELQALRGYEGIILGKLEVGERPTWEARVTPPQALNLPDGRTVFFQWIKRQEVDFRPGHFYLDLGEQLDLTLRFWRPGDVFQPLGLGFKKKLQDFFVDRKIVRERRFKLPILCAGKEVACIVGLEVSELFKVREGTERVLHVYLKEECENE